MDKLLWIGLVLVLFVSCKKTEPYTSDLDYSYFPIQEGYFVEYHVLEVIHDENVIPSVDSTEYFLKISVGEKILDNTGDSVNKLNFFIKNHVDSTYVLDKVNTLYNNGFQGVYNLDNQKYVKLAFPADPGESWDMNAYNTYDELVSEVIQKDYSGIVNGTAFSNLLHTQQLDFFSLVDYQKAHEFYAKDVGLVQIYFKDLVIQNFDTTQIRRGQEIYWDYLSSGQE